VAHREQQEFVDRCKTRFPKHFKNCRVLEVGSRNINGGVRGFFEGCDYVGIDCQPGKDVDVVCNAHEYDSDEPFDTVISCEAFEHDPHFKETLDNALRLLRPGGLFVATFAGPNRQEHGTARSAGGELYGPDPDYYKNVSADEFRKAADHRRFDLLEVVSARNDTDVYAVGVKTAVKTSGQDSTPPPASVAKRTKSSESI